MTNEDKNDALYQKMSDELRDYKEWLLAKSRKEILENASQYVIYEEILFALEHEDITNEQADALLKANMPLEGVYYEYQNQNADCKNVLSAIIGRANKIIMLDTLQTNVPEDKTENALPLDELRHRPKYGKWIIQSDENDWAKWDQCSECGYQLSAIGEAKNKKMRYCPGCGAKMEFHN